RTVSFFGWSGSAISVEKLTKNRRLVTGNLTAHDCMRLWQRPCGPSQRKTKAWGNRDKSAHRTDSLLANRWLHDAQAALRQQIVAPTSFHNPTNELANRRPLGQNDARIDIRSIAFGPRNVWLIGKQFQFLADFFASEIMSNGLLHRHRCSVTCVLYLCGNLVRHPGRTGTLFLRIFEDSKTFEPALTNEIQ